MADNKTIPIAWIKDLDSTQKEDFEKYLRNSHTLIKKLRQIVIDRINSVEKEATSKKSYDSPSWPYLQADTIGESRGLQYILELTDFMT